MMGKQGRMVLWRHCGDEKQGRGRGGVDNLTRSRGILPGLGEALNTLLISFAFVYQTGLAQNTCEMAFIASRRRRLIGFNPRAAWDALRSSILHDGVHGNQSLPPVSLVASALAVAFRLHRDDMATLQLSGECTSANGM